MCAGMALGCFKNVKEGEEVQVVDPGNKFCKQKKEPAAQKSVMKEPTEKPHTQVHLPS
jgi:uncharacterized protein involved in tellurium resistance